MMRNIANEKQAIERYDEDEECSIDFTYLLFHATRTNKYPD